MSRARLAIFALFWIAWVVLLPFAHHHLVRAPREATAIQCREPSCSAQCVACQWESVSAAEIEQPLLIAPLLRDTERLSLVSLLSYRTVTGASAPRAPPLG